MNKQRRKRLAREIEESITVPRSPLATMTRFAQKRPWTFVEITYWFGDDSWILGWGFAKANWPDKWSPEYGRRLAVEKAAAHIVKQLADRDATVLAILMGNAGVVNEDNQDEIDYDVGEPIGEFWMGNKQSIVDVRVQ